MTKFNCEKYSELEEKISTWWKSTISEAVKASLISERREFLLPLPVEIVETTGLTNPVIEFKVRYFYGTSRYEVETRLYFGDECHNCGTAWQCDEDCQRSSRLIPISNGIKRYIENYFNNLIEVENKRIAEQLSVFE